MTKQQIEDYARTFKVDLAKDEKGEYVMFDGMPVSKGLLDLYDRFDKLREQNKLAADNDV